MLKKVRSCGKFDSHSCSAGYKHIPWVTPMKLLHIDSSVLGPHSVSRQVSAAIVDRLRAATPSLEIAYRDLTQTPLAISPARTLRPAQGAPAPAELGPGPCGERRGAERVYRCRHRRDRRADVQFHHPEPAQGLDRPRPRGGEDVQVRRNGPEGLAGGKRVIVAISRGGYYGAGTPAASLEHLETYLRGVLAFMGITSPNSLSPTASRSAQSIARSHSRTHFRPPPACARRKTHTDTAAAGPRRRLTDQSS